MALNPGFWAELERELGPFPTKGQYVRVRFKNGDVVSGVVTLVWCGIEPCIDVECHGAKFHAYPSLGDIWEPL